MYKIRKLVPTTIEVSKEEFAEQIVEARIYTSPSELVLDCYTCTEGMLHRVCSIPLPISFDDSTDSQTLLEYARQEVPNRISYLDLT